MKKKYFVTLTRTATRTKDIEVSAETATEAKQIALDRAGNEVFDNNEKDAEYDVTDICLKE